MVLPDRSRSGPANRLARKPPSVVNREAGGGGEMGMDEAEEIRKSVMAKATGSVPASTTEHAEPPQDDPYDDQSSKRKRLSEDGSSMHMSRTSSATEGTSVYRNEYDLASNNDGGGGGTTVGGVEAARDGENKRGESNDHEEPTHGQDNDEHPLDEEAEPDWDAVSRHEPAKSDAPVFLRARDNRQESLTRASRALDTYLAVLDRSKEELLAVAADIFNGENQKLASMEEELKRGFIRNEEDRASIEDQVKKSAEAAQGLFANLLMTLQAARGGAQAS